MRHLLVQLLLKFLGFQIGLRLYNKFATDTPPLAIVQPAVAAVEIVIKEPAGYDLSHWKIVSDWNNISPRPLLMGTKATQSINYRDPTFPEYFTKFKEIVGCRRLAYHFFNKNANSVSQADYFASYIRPYLTDDDILCLDFEQGGETASMLWAFLDRLHHLFPNNLIVVYSRKNLVDLISMTALEKEYFKGFPFWTAGYPFDPNPYTTTPIAFIPDPSKWGPVWKWQYTSSGHVQGIVGDTDCNLIEPAFIEWLGSPTEEPMTYRYTATAIWNGTRIRADHNTASNYVNSYPAGTVFEGDELFVAPINLSNSGGIYQEAGDKWLKVVTVNGQPPRTSTGQAITSPVWVAIVHLGDPICDLVDHGETPPTEPVPPRGVVVTDQDGVNWEATVFTRLP